VPSFTKTCANKTLNKQLFSIFILMSPLGFHIPVVELHEKSQHELVKHAKGIKPTGQSQSPGAIDPSPTSS